MLYRGGLHSLYLKILEILIRQALDIQQRKFWSDYLDYALLSSLDLNRTKKSQPFSESSLGKVIHNLLSALCRLLWQTARIP